MRFYFDHNATTPVCPEALEAFVSASRDDFGNASSVHREGQAARRRIEQAREHVALLLGCREKEVVFTSGGTESDALAILGGVRACRRPGRHVITTAIEHPAVRNTCRQLEREDVAVTFVRPERDGWVNPESVRSALRPGTALISVMHANNETGVVQPVAEIAAIAREAGALFHCDGVQAAGRIPVRVADLGADLYSISGHKLGAPKGIGALYVRTGVAIEPLQYGGRHEGGRRPGTENVPGAAALGAAAEFVGRDMDAESKRVSDLRYRIERRVAGEMAGVTVNGWTAPRLPNTVNICFEGIEGEALVIALDLRGFAVSSGSACSSGAVEPSHVLTAMGLTPERAKASLRFSVGRGNDKAQVDALVDAIAASVAHLRRLSPVYSHA